MHGTWLANAAGILEIAILTACVVWILWGTVRLAVSLYRHSRKEKSLRQMIDALPPLSQEG